MQFNQRDLVTLVDPPKDLEGIVGFVVEQRDDSLLLEFITNSKIRTVLVPISKVKTEYKYKEPSDDFQYLLARLAKFSMARFPSRNTNSEERTRT